jgi:hypothetical protein
MSTPLPPRPPGSPAPSATRQLLDELDALMERMLALPVNDLGDALEQDGAAPTDASEAPTVAATPAFPPPAADISPPEAAIPEKLPAPTEGPADVTGGRPVAPHPPSPGPPGPHRKPELRLATEPPITAEPPVFSPAGLWQLPSPPVSEPGPRSAGPGTAPLGRPVPGFPRRPVAADRRLMPAPPRLAGWGERLLVWSNRTFDRWTCRLGWPGRWLQGTTGRTLLGWLGVSLLFVAAVWGLSTWFDWTW